MDEKSFSISPKRRELLFDIINKFKPFQPVIKNGLRIQFSEYKGNILLSIMSTINAKYTINYFSDENEACNFITSCFLDASFYTTDEE